MENNVAQVKHKSAYDMHIYRMDIDVERTLNAVNKEIHRKSIGSDLFSLCTGQYILQLI